VVVVRDKGERPSRQYVFTESREYEPEELENWEIYRPNGIITFGVLNAGSIPVFCDVGVNVFH